MTEQYANRKVGGWRKVLAAVAAILLTALPWIHPVSVFAAEKQSYMISIEELQKPEPEELPEYGEVKTADAPKSTAAWLAVLLLGTGWILDRIYLDKWEGRHE